MLDFKPMAEWGAIAEKDLELLHYARTRRRTRSRSSARISPGISGTDDRAGSRGAGNREDAG